MSEIIERNSLSEQYLCAAKKNFTLQNNLSNSNSKVLIGHFSDIHTDRERFRNAMKLFEHYCPDFVIHTGDTVRWNTEDDSSFFYADIEKRPFPIYNCIGNHETFNNSRTNTNEELYEEFIKPLPNIVNEDEKCYYYADNEKHKIRVIALHNYEYYTPEAPQYLRNWYAFLQPQCDWLIKTLKDAAEKDLSVIIFDHEGDERIPPNHNDLCFTQRYAPSSPWGPPKFTRQNRPHIVNDIVDAFKHGKALKREYEWKDFGETVKVDTVFEKKGDFICHLSGHFHGDFVGYLPSYPDQLSITMTCSACHPEGGHNFGEELSDLPRIPGTVSEDAVNFYTIDKEKRTISIVRFGAIVNDEMKMRVGLKLNY